MKLFLDTSALAKLFQEEPGTDYVDEAINSPDNEIWVLELVEIEFLSCIYRRYREGEISDEDINIVSLVFEEQIRQFNVEMLGSSIIEEARQLMQEYGKEAGLRTLDSLHLAACRLLYEPGWFFVCSDKRLCDIALQAGIQVKNPIGVS